MRRCRRCKAVLRSANPGPLCGPCEKATRPEVAIKTIKAALKAASALAGNPRVAKRDERKEESE